MNLINSYPLYDALLKDVDGPSKSRLSKKELLKKLNKLEETHRDSIYLIIKMYFLKHEKVNNVFDIPYEGKSINTHVELIDSNEILQDIQFDLQKLPHKLIKMLDIFCKKYCDN